MMGIDRTMPGTGVGWGKQSRDSRHMSVADPSKLKSSKPGSPATTASRPGSRQVESSSAMWLDRNPQEFLRMMRKTASEPQLLPAKPKRSAAADASGEKQSARKSEVRATDIIAAQKKADAEKEAKDLETAERNSYVFQQQYSQLVNQRVQKTAQCESLTEQAKQATKETELLEGEVEVLRYRLATLKHEVGAMEAEMVMEIDTTPRYEHMSRRSRKAVEQLADRCVKPQRELVELLTKMKRKGGSHLSTQFESEALLQAVERLGVQLQGRHKFNAKEIEQLKVESADAKESQEVLKDIMLRRHESSLQLSGDKSAEEEAALAQAAGEMGGKSAARAIEKVYTRERVAEIERQYAKLSAAFAETDPELLVERVLRMTTGSQSEKVENMNRDAEAAKERAAVLRDELLQHQTRLEEMRFEGDGRSSGFLVLTPRGENVMDYGGDEEVIDKGDRIRGSARLAAEAVERYRRLALLITSASISLSGMMHTASPIPAPNGVPKSLEGVSGGGTIPLHATPEALEHVEQRLLSTANQFERVAVKPNANQAPEFVDKAAKKAVRAYNTGYARHVASWSSPNGSRATSRHMTPRSGPMPPDEGDEEGDDGAPSAAPPSPTEEMADGGAGGLFASISGPTSPTPNLEEANEKIGMVSLPKARGSRGAIASRGSDKSSKAGTDSKNRSPRTILPPLPMAALAPASANGLPPPPSNMFNQMNRAKSGEFGSALHLAHVTKMQLDFGDQSNNIRIPLTLEEEDEDDVAADDDDDDDAEEDLLAEKPRRGGRQPAAGAKPAGKGALKASAEGGAAKGAPPKKKGVTIKK